MSAPVTAKVEMDTGGVWTDITAYTRIGPGVGITRGRQDEQGTPGPARATLVVNNADGRFSPRNPTGPYYGTFGRNSLIRVTAGLTGGTPHIRFVGEVASWPPEWDYSEHDVWVPVTAAGVRRRLGQGRAVRDVMSRVFLTSPGSLGYWPMSDPNDSTYFAALSSGGAPLVPSGTVDYAANSSAFPGLPALATFNGATAVADLPASANILTAGLLVFAPSGLGALTHSLLTIMYTGGGVGFAELGLLANTGQLSLSLYNAAGAFIAGASTGVVDDIRNRAVRVQAKVYQNGANVEMILSVATLGAANVDYTDTANTLTLGTPTRIGVGDSGAIASRTPITGISVGQLAVAAADLDPAYYLRPMELYAGETAFGRILRLCAEEGVDLAAGGPTGPGDYGVALGPQLPGTLLGLLDEAALADDGVLAEAVDDTGLVYTVGFDLYNQAAAATVSYALGHLREFAPVEDDQGLVNDLTVARADGGSARYELTTGALSVQDPPDGVGRYDASLSLSVESDDQLPDQASWRVRQGTIDEARYPGIGLDLPNCGLHSGDIDDLLALREGQMFIVQDPPGFAGAPDDIRQLVLGWTETIRAHTWEFTLTGRPAAGHDVGVYNDDNDFLLLEPGSRYSSDGTVTAEALDTTENAIDVSTPSGPIWTTDPAEYPFYLNVGGEQIRAAGCTGSGTAQTFTGCTRSVNGVVKSHLIGAEVTLWQPARYALWRE